MTKLSFPNVAFERLRYVLDTQASAIAQAATVLTDTIETGNVVQTFGTGHSREVTLELTGRAGGLAAVGMLAVKDLVMFGGVEPKDILDPKYEREPGLAKRIYDLAQPHPGDAFLIVSNSGINPAIVEMAELAKHNGHPLIAVTSIEHTSRVSSRDRSGTRLADLADVVIDNGAPAGDAAVELTNGMRIGGVSHLTGIFIAQMLAESICRELLNRGQTVPVFISANLPEGDAHNESLYRRYQDRVRPIEP